MKIVVLNGSPRKGNTRFAVYTMIRSLKDRYPDAEVEVLPVYNYEIKACCHCNACRKNGGSCMLIDDSNTINDKLQQADMLVIGSPVYWWGLSGQLKMVIDKLYAKGELLKTVKKQVAAVIIGEAELDNPQYRIIREQLECMCDYLEWNLRFVYPVSAYEPGDLSKNHEATAELQRLTGEL